MFSRFPHIACVGIIANLLLLSGACATGNRAAGISDSAGPLRIRELALVDDTGSTRFLIDASDDSGCGAVSLRLSDGRPIAQFRVDSDGLREWALVDEVRSSVIVMSALPEGGAMVSCASGSRMPRAAIVYRPSGGPQLLLADESGVVTAMIAATDSGSVALLKDGSGRTRSRWFVRRDGHANLEFLDERGDVIWRAIDEEALLPTTRPSPRDVPTEDDARFAVVELSKERTSAHTEQVQDSAGTVWYRSAPVLTEGDFELGSAWVRELGDADYGIQVFMKDSSISRAFRWSGTNEGATIGILLDEALQCVTTIANPFQTYIVICGFSDAEAAENALRGMRSW